MTNEKVLLITLAWIHMILFIDSNDPKDSNLIADRFSRTHANGTNSVLPAEHGPSSGILGSGAVNLFGPPPGPPLVVYSQPNLAPAPQDRLRIVPQAYFRRDPTPSQPQNSSSSPTSLHSPISSYPSTSNPSRTSSSPSTAESIIGLMEDSRSPTTVPPAPTTSTGHRGIHVFTTPFGLAWRRFGFFLGQPGTDAVTKTTFPPSARHVPATEAGATASGSSPALLIRSEGRTRSPDSPAPNRIKGKPHILCMSGGIMFIAETYLPFDGVIAARGHENRTNCIYDSDRNNAEIQQRSINVSFPYKECGDPIIAKKGDHMYQTDVVVTFRDGRIQKYLARCISQKLHYEDEDLPQKVEEALEELNITPTRVESQAVMPMCTMRVIQEIEDDQHRYGPSNGSIVQDATIGQQLRMEFALQPASAAFGFLIRNCTVLDSTVDTRYVVIDDKGCSVDINILAHPHYDIYNDLAIVHWHAFKVPDSALLSFKCDCVVCTEIPDGENGQTSCEQIPTPPVCPDVVTSSMLQNALIFDTSQNQLLASKKRRREAVDQNVKTGYCLTANGSTKYCDFTLDEDRQLSDHYEGDSFTCMSRYTIAISSGFNVALLVTSLISLFLIPYLRRKGRQRRRNDQENVLERSSSTPSNGDR